MRKGPHRSPLLMQPMEALQRDDASQMQPRHAFVTSGFDGLQTGRLDWAGKRRDISFETRGIICHLCPLNTPQELAQNCSY